ncbi:MAG: DUF885 domain-containing protein [Clostridiales bacterium]|nr:DUF885 domain-containing protein [Clostridiales bacterium]
MRTDISFDNHGLNSRFLRKLLPAGLCILLFLLFVFISNRQNAPDSSSSDFLSPSYDRYAREMLASQAEFDEFTNELFRSQLSGSALDLHYLLADPEASAGIETYICSLGSFSPEDLAASSDSISHIRQILSGFDPETLTEGQRLTYDILDDYLTVSQMGQDYLLYTEPLTPTTGIQVELPILLAEYKFRCLQDVEDYLLLLEDMPRYFGTILQLEQKKSEKGIFMNDELVTIIQKSCENFTHVQGCHLLTESFEEKLVSLPGISSQLAEEYQERHQQILENSVAAAYQTLIDGLEQLKGTGEYQGGLCQYSAGKEYYQYLIRRSTGSDKTPEELQQLILHQLTQDLSQLAYLRQHHPDTVFSFPITEPEAILHDLENQITSDFPPLPIQGTFPVIRQVPESLEQSSSPAFYLSCPVDDLTDNVIYVNPSSLASSSDHLYATLAHEGYPGHLYQTVFSSSQNMYPIRFLLNYPGFTEGWATYVEQLSYTWVEEDLQEAASMAGLNASIGLGLSALLDLQIHNYNYSLENTINFLSQFLYIDEEQVKILYNEILGNPANYLKYYAGYLEILSLKEYARELTGEYYSDLDFHQALLTIGEAPFPIIKKYLPDYMETVQESGE